LIFNIPLIILLLTPVLVITSSSWVLIWIWIEINAISFIIIIKNTENKIKYFLIQSLASTILLSIFVIYRIKEIKISNIFLVYSIIILSLVAIIKIGIAPFHSWLIKICSLINWNNILIILTWQKIIPLFIFLITINNYWLIPIILTSFFIGTISQMRIRNVKLILAFSSIRHIGWIISSNYYRKIINFFYLFIYSIISVIIINVIKKNNSFKLFDQKKNIKKLFIIILSLAGIPPLLGFLPKWLIIDFISKRIKRVTLIILILILATINFFIYSRLTTSSLIEKRQIKIFSTKSYSKENVLNLFLPILILSKK